MGLTLPLTLAAEKLVWGKIREGVGGRVKVVVSGGSSLPSYLEDFFEMAGLRCGFLDACHSAHVRHAITRPTVLGMYDARLWSCLVVYPSNFTSRRVQAKGCATVGDRQVKLAS